MVYRLSPFRCRNPWNKKITTKIYNDKTFTKKENYPSSIKSISLDLLFISFLRYSQFNLPNCLDQDVDPGIWPYHLFRVDCLVSIYGRSWVGKLFVGEDNRQNRETIIDIRKNRNPDWDISRISFFSLIQLLPYLWLVTSMAAKFVFSCSGTKNGSSVFACVDPNNIYGGDPSCHVQIFRNRGS